MPMLSVFNPDYLMYLIEYGLLHYLVVNNLYCFNNVKHEISMHAIKIGWNWQTDINPTEGQWMDLKTFSNLNINEIVSLFLKQLLRT